MVIKIIRVNNSGEFCWCPVRLMCDSTQSAHIVVAWFTTRLVLVGGGQP